MQTPQHNTRRRGILRPSSYKQHAQPPANLLSRRQHALRLAGASHRGRDAAAARLPDALGKSVLKYKKVLTPHEFYRIVDRARGRYELRAMSPADHPAAMYLNHLREHGADVILNLPHDLARLEQQIRKGAHPSARARSAFFRAEVLDQVRKGHLLVLPLSIIKHIPHLYLSPAACIPQEGRRDRPIYDYTYSGLNKAVTLSAPPEAMQFGRALPRLLRHIVNADPRLGPVFMSKTDLSDAYMRVWIRIEDVPKLAFVIPEAPGDRDVLVGFHLSCPMGYVESAPLFCATTETIADLANNDVKFTHPHPLDHIADTPPPPDDTAHLGLLTHRQEDDLARHFSTLTRDEKQHCLSYVDVYVDDFILLQQGLPAQREAARRNLFHHIDRVFRPNDAHDVTRTEVNSIKKLRKGDAAFTVIKKILGWDVNSLSHHLCITPSRLQKVNVLLDHVRDKRRTNGKTWHKILGTLRSLSPGVPGGRGLLSVLQRRTPVAPHRVRITPAAAHTLHLWKRLFHGMHNRPTHLRELFPHPPSWFGATDACGYALGGVFFNSRGDAFVWQWPLPAHIQRQVRTCENPKGAISINVLELAAHVTQNLLKTPHMRPLEHTLDGVDSTAAHGWTLRGSVTRDDAIAGLLAWKALNLRASVTASSSAYVPGRLNIQADDASRVRHSSPLSLVSFFNAKYPQKHSWQHVPLPSAIAYALTTVLSGGPWRPESLPVTPSRTVPTGPNGNTSALSSASSPTSRTSVIPSLFSKFLHIECAPANSPKEENQSKNAKSNNTCAPWARTLPAWGPVTPATTHLAKSTSAFRASYAATLERTLLRNESSPSPQPCSTTSTTTTSAEQRESNASQTSSGLASFSSCAQENTATPECTTTPHPSASATSRSVGEAPPLTQHATPSNNSPPPTTLPSPSPHKKTESKVKSSAQGVVDTQQGVRFAACFTAWRIFDADAPPLQSLLQATTTVLSGEC